MAKEEKTEREETKEIKEIKDASPDSGKGKRGLLKLGIIGIAVLVVAGGGFFGWKVFSKKGGDDSGHPSAVSKAEEGDKKGVPGHIIALDSFVVNLADSTDIKYLKITINLEVASEKDSEEVQARMPQIRDALLMLLTSKTSDDVKDIGGKLKLQDEMVARVNNYLKEGKARAVYFTEFVMQ